MLSKTFIATLLVSTAAAAAIPTITTADPTYKLLTFPTGAGSTFRGLEITADNGKLWVGKQTTQAVEFSFNRHRVSFQGQILYISNDAITYAAPDADVQNTAGWMFTAPYSAPDVSLGILKYPGYVFYACPSETVYTISAVKTENKPEDDKCEEIQLVAQKVETA